MPSAQFLAEITFSCAKAFLNLDSWCSWQHFTLRIREWIIPLYARANIPWRLLLLSDYRVSHKLPSAENTILWAVLTGSISNSTLMVILPTSSQFHTATLYSILCLFWWRWRAPLSVEVSLFLRSTAQPAQHGMSGHNSYFRSATSPPLSEVQI